MNAFRRILLLLLPLFAVACSDSKSDRTEDVTDCVAAVMYERTTGSTMPGCP